MLDGSGDVSEATRGGRFPPQRLVDAASAMVPMVDGDVRRESGASGRRFNRDSDQGTLIREEIPGHLSARRLPRSGAVIEVGQTDVTVTRPTSRSAVA
jgi:hypothetical protein